MYYEVKIPSSFNRLLTFYGKKIGDLVNYRFRSLLVITGKDPVLMGTLASRAILYYSRHRRRFDKRHYNGLYIYHDEFDDAVLMKEVFSKNIDSKLVDFQYAVYERSEKYLGSTFSYLVMDLTKDLKPNDLGRLIGIVEGGGLIVLLAPPWNEWDEFMTIFKRNLTIPQFPTPRHVFITWFKRKLLEHEAIGIYDSVNASIIRKFELKRQNNVSREKIVIPQKILFPRKIYELALTSDQVKVIKLMEQLFEKPSRGKKKVIVITADRGRGKSCAVGLGSVGLIHLLRTVKPKPRILVTAPSPSNVQSLMMLAMKALDSLNYKYKVFKREGNVIELRSERFSIEYWEPIHIPKIKGDIVVVDEAAGIHVPMLYKIWRSHDRIVFSTTIHGYEGAGRGFSVRLLQKIRSDKNTQLIEYEMDEPIRYARNDPIEEWQFKTLLLDAEPADLDEEDLRDIKEGNLEYIEYTQDYLFSKEGEDELRQLFGIYVLAHYRNEPDDLGMIADAPHHIVRAVKTRNGKIVCALQIAYEGRIADDIASELLRGGRIPGNIIPDRFLKHLRYRGFSKLFGWRIVRIATHPMVQGRGIGSWALNKISEEARERGLDWVAAGFGVNEELFKFWLKNGFYPIHISPDRNPVSGEYTVLVIKPLNKEAERFVEMANKEFKLKLLDSLAINYRDLEIEVAYQLLSSGKPLLKQIPENIFSPIQLDRLWVYCMGPMTFEAAADIMHKIAKIHWLVSKEQRPELSKIKEYILIGKALQGRSWEELEKEYRVLLKDLHKYSHEIACRYFEFLTGVKPEDHEPGVDILDYELKLIF
ncbi:MAG: ATPase [Desulfurococcales archaeon ex4484_58]|nr:MAG: ATPase [Desulfurococcales archaeon ex4484_58]